MLFSLPAQSVAFADATAAGIEMRIAVHLLGIAPEIRLDVHEGDVAADLLQDETPVGKVARHEGRVVGRATSGALGHAAGLQHLVVGEHGDLAVALGGGDEVANVGAGRILVVLPAAPPGAARQCWRKKFRWSCSPLRTRRRARCRRRFRPTDTGSAGRPSQWRLLCPPSKRRPARASCPNRRAPGRRDTCAIRAARRHAAGAGAATAARAGCRRGAGARGTGSPRILRPIAVR